IVEEGPSDAVIDAPKHPYTQALVSAVPIPGEEKSRRIILEGEIPSPSNPPKGCPFHPRCSHAMEICRRDQPVETVVEGHRVACHLFKPAEGAAS
ncbi:MAG: ABC transporter ATP-binding protein, partial [Lentisphaerota bacterium]